MTTDNTIDSEQLYVQFVSHFLGNHNSSNRYEVNQCGCVARFQDESAAQEANKAQHRLLLDLEQAAMEANDLAALEFIVGHLETSRIKLTAEKGEA